MHYNVALIIPEPLFSAAITLSRSFLNDNPQIVLDGMNYIPHASLYMTDFEAVTTPQLVGRLQTIAKNQQSFELKAEKFYMNQTHYIDIQYIRDGVLERLHGTIIAQVADLRVVNQVDRSRFTGPNAEERYQNVVEFGYDIGRRLYRPHITLTKFQTNNREAFESLQWGDFDFTVTKFGLFEADELGACRRLVESFELAQFAS